MSRRTHQTNLTGRTNRGLQAVAVVSAVVLCAAAIYWLSLEEPRRTPVSCDVFVDQSGSIKSEEQLTQWREVFAKLLDRLGPLDSLRIFGIHDQTTNAAPIFQAELRDLPEGAGLKEVKEWRAELARVREEATKAFHQSLRPQQRASTTDILSSLDRIKPDRARKREVWFMSDMLQATRELNLEKTALSEENIAGLLNPVVANHQWQKGALAGVEVYCLLNSVGINGPSPLNDRHILERFWKTLFEHLGADLKMFETHVTL